MRGGRGGSWFLPAAYLFLVGCGDGLDELLEIDRFDEAPCCMQAIPMSKEPLPVRRITSKRPAL